MKIHIENLTHVKKPLNTLTTKFTHICACVYLDQNTTLCQFSGTVHFFCFETGSRWLELTKQARLAGQYAPGIWLCPHPQYWVTGTRCCTKF